MATKITVTLVHSGELPRFAVDVLEEVIHGGRRDPSEILAWFSEYIADDPAWDFTAKLSEEEEGATE